MKKKNLLLSFLLVIVTVIIAVSGTTAYFTAQKTGTLAGRLLVKLANVKNLENGCNGPEIEAEPNCEADNLGELGKVINVKVLLDNQEKAQSTLADDQTEVIANQWNNLPPIILNPKESKTITLNWQANDTDYGNEVQSDSVEFDLNFRLVQMNKTP